MPSVGVSEPDSYFVCQRCTACCRWPGDVKVSAAEIDAIAGFLAIPVAEFIERFTRLRTDRNGLSIIERPNHECSMLEDGGCRIHPVKPEQCRGFPNKWNFPGWRDVCEAIPLPLGEARARGLA
jgi:Fe-S-cluster containining protein